MSDARSRHPDFRSLAPGQFRQVLEAFPIRRKVLAVHLHHTWRPNHGQYRGLETIVGMWRFHTQELGWSDIAQHLTIAPDGTLWTGRDWNRPPASSAGFNGNSSAGPFMIEMVGDFDVGRDRLEGKQRAAVVEVLAQLHDFFDLKDDTLAFHNEMSSKSCPGTSVDRQQLLKEVRDARSKIRQAAAKGAGGRGLRPFSSRALAVQSVVADLADRERGRAAMDDPADAEPPEAGALLSLELGGARGAEGARGGFDLTPEVLAELAPHVVNLTDGRLSAGGSATSGPGEVRAIFEDHLPRALEAARAAKRPLRVVFYAHGGLVNETAGLGIAYKHLEWWRRNGVYPINFVWETGLLGTIRSLLFGPRAGAARAARDLFPDWLVVKLARGLGGEKVWSGMKRSAERAAEKPASAGAPPESYGGARFAAERLAAFLAQHPNDAIELHAVGHSAGSIFHAHFLPAALEEGIKGFQSTHFLAPAITVEAFERRLAGLAGKGIGPITLFTMKKAFERADETFEIYDKSLLYLIHHALEPKPETPILGLEESLRDDAEMRSLFALDGSPPKRGEVVWSKTAATGGRNASTATTHGGFDDDAPTMNSVLRRIVGVGDEAEIVDVGPFLEEWESRTGARGLGLGAEIDDELAGELRRLAPGWSTASGSFPLPGSGPVPAGPWAEGPPPGGGAPPLPGGPAAGTLLSGRRRALCVGIDRYPTSPLAGCVADARLWAETLTGLGFETPDLLLDEEATRSAILGSLERLIADSHPGDVLVFQYAGHGTHLPDVDGDEDDATDEALCSIDWEEGRAVIDDDLAEVFARLPAGVNLTAFMDCCHSGTNTRLAAARGAAAHPDRTARRRYVVAAPAVRERHAEFRRRLGASRGAAGDRPRGPEGMSEVSFAACQPWEVAWESAGHGEFTVHATRLLGSGGTAWTHERFERRVQEAFGSTPRQKPMLDCAPSARGGVLLQALAAGAQGTAAAPPASPGGGRGQAEVARLLRAIADAVE